MDHVHAAAGAVEQQRLTGARAREGAPVGRPQAHAHQALVGRRRQVDPAARPAGDGRVVRADVEHDAPGPLAGDGGVHGHAPDGRCPGEEAGSGGCGGPRGERDQGADREAETSAAGHGRILSGGLTARQPAQSTTRIARKFPCSC